MVIDLQLIFATFVLLLGKLIFHCLPLSHLSVVGDLVAVQVDDDHGPPAGVVWFAACDLHVARVAGGGDGDPRVVIALLVEVASGVGRAVDLQILVIHIHGFTVLELAELELRICPASDLH